MSSEMVLRSTRVVTPEGTRPACVRVIGERIAAVGGYDDAPRGADVRDAGDLVLMPGVIDPHVHVNEPGRTEWEGFETATAAAAVGGVTTIVDMPLNSIPATTSAAALHAKREAARGRVAIDVGFWGGVVPGNASELDALCDAGVLGFKCFLAPSGVDEFAAVAEADLRVALPVLARRRMPLLAHAESADVLARVHADGPPDRYSTWLASRPPEAELEAIAMLLRLAREFGARIHIVHLSAAAALPMLRAARRDGLPVTVETCPHYLTFAAEDVPAGATSFKCAPPIRDRANREALWHALAAGDIDLIATDHSPCPPSMKCAGSGDFLRAWGGIASLQLALAVTWTGARARGHSADDVSRWLSRGPSRLAGLSHRKGSLASGMDADIVLWDPDEPWVVDAETLRHRHKVTPYAGARLVGRVRETWVRGQLVSRDGGLTATEDPRGALLTTASS